MSETKINPRHITKPLQLLAAWLAGLAIVDAAFLTAAATITAPSWIPGLLAVAAVANVPVFLVSLFLLQTKFRPEMQEDTFYSKYLERTYSSSDRIPKPVDLDRQISNMVARIEQHVEGISSDQAREVSNIFKEAEVEHLAERHQGSRSLSELYAYPNLWSEIARDYGGDESFDVDVAALVQDGLAVLPDGRTDQAELTDLGREIAGRLEAKNKLWNQENGRWTKSEPRHLPPPRKSS